jgi:malate dehydrogenase (oxaloacetate-decarboxylating)(NADP+)
VSGQGNNSYIFPGVGLGVVACQARLVTDRMFAAAARTLASLVLPSDLELGRIYPALTRIREVSAHIGAAVAEVAFQDGLADVPRPADVKALVMAEMWRPEYRSYLARA